MTPAARNVQAVCRFAIGWRCAGNLRLVGCRSKLGKLPHTAAGASRAPRGSAAVPGERGSYLRAEPGIYGGGPLKIFQTAIWGKLYVSCSTLPPSSARFRRPRPLIAPLEDVAAAPVMRATATERRLPLPLNLLFEPILAPPRFAAAAPRTRSAEPRRRGWAPSCAPNGR